MSAELPSIGSVEPFGRRLGDAVGDDDAFGAGDVLHYHRSDHASLNLSASSRAVMSGANAWREADPDLEPPLRVALRAGWARGE